MIKRCIGIDIGSTYLSAVQMTRSAEQLYIEKTFRAQMRRSTDSLPSHLKQLFSKHGFDPHATVALSIPNTQVFFHKLEADSAQGPLNALNCAMLKQEFPAPADELILQFSPQCNAVSNHIFPAGRTVVAATTKSSLRELLDTAATASIIPSLVTPAVFAAHSTIKINYPEISDAACIIALIDDANLTLAVVENHSIVLIRSLPLVSKESDSQPLAERIADILLQEADVTWNRLYGTDIGGETIIYIVPSCSDKADILPLLEQKMNCQAIIPDPCRLVKSSAEGPIDSTICTAEGLALQLLEPEQNSGINFLQAADFEADPAPSIKKNLVVCACLGAAIVVLLVVGLFARLFTMEKESTYIKNELKQIFTKTIPDEKAIVDPLAQLEQRLKLLQADYAKFDPASAGAARPLQILRDISLSSPSQSNITVNNILLTKNSARLSGSSASFKSVYDWQNLLQKNPKFSAVEIVDIGAAAQTSAQPRAEVKPGEPVKFTILISLDNSEKI